jgi:hypothetical protein
LKVPTVTATVLSNGGIKPVHDQAKLAVLARRTPNFCFVTCVNLHRFIAAQCNAAIAKLLLPGRSNTAVKNFWHCRLKSGSGTHTNRYSSHQLHQAASQQ